MHLLAHSSKVDALLLNRTASAEPALLLIGIKSNLVRFFEMHLSSQGHMEADNSNQSIPILV